MTKQVAVIDYGMGNLHSVASALNHVEEKLDVQVTSDADLIRNADHVIFPGVGAIRDCMAEIRRTKADVAVAEAIASQKPVLAICVGMQAMMQKSEENEGVDCLGHFEGQVKFFACSPEFQAANEKAEPFDKMKVPHMGWNTVKQTVDHPLWQGISNNARFYFVHSYFVAPGQETLASGVTEYGIPFAASLAQKNVFATQFHPEKSHTNGLQLLKNFIHWNGTW